MTKLLLASLLIATPALASETDLRTEIEVLRKELASEESRIAKLETTVSLLFAVHQLQLKERLQENLKQSEEDLGHQHETHP